MAGLNTDQMYPWPANTLTGFESMPADLQGGASAQGGATPVTGALSLAAILFAAVAGQPTALTATSGAVTSNATKASLTTDALALTSGQTYKLTVTASGVTANSRVYASLRNGTNTKVLSLGGGLPVQITSIVVASTSIVFTLAQIAPSNDNAGATNGTFIIDYVYL